MHKATLPALAVAVVPPTGDFPTVGISPDGLRRFIADHGGADALKGLCTAEVCERFVKPETAATGESYADLLASQPSTAADVGTATVFVSHAWSHMFLDIVDALLSWDKRTRGGRRPDDGEWPTQAVDGEQSTPASPTGNASLVELTRGTERVVVAPTTCH